MICRELAKSPTSPSRAEQSGEVLIFVTYNNITRKIRLSRKDDAATVEKAICMALGLTPGTPIGLMNAEEEAAPISGNLAPGNYSVSSPLF